MKVETSLATAPSGERGTARTIAWWVVGTGVVLLAVDALSGLSSFARRGFVNDHSHPPIFGGFHPRAHPQLALAILAGALGVIGARAAIRKGVKPAVLLGIAPVFLFTFSTLVAYLQGRSLAVWGVRTYLDRSDAPIVGRLGVRGFVRAYPDIAPRLRSIHAVTHPPGRVVVAWMNEHLWPQSLMHRAMTLAAIASLLLIPVWFVARRLAGERAALFTVLLLAASPGPVMMAFVSHEATESVLFFIAIALLVAGGAWDDTQRPILAVAGGFVLGLTTFLTYATVFIAIFIVLLAFWSRPWRAAVRTCALAALGGIAALVVLRVALGYDVLVAYRASHDGLVEFLRLNPNTPGFSARPYVYWLLGNPAAWMTFAGIPIAALALRELIPQRPRYLLALLVPVVGFYLVPGTISHIIPGEVERTVQYAYPLAAIAAAAGLVRAEKDSPSLPIVLIALAVVQTIVLQSLFFTFW